MIFTVIKRLLCNLTVNKTSDYGQIKEYINDDRKPKLEINSGTPGMLNNMTHAFPGSSTVYGADNRTHAASPYGSR